MSTIVTRSGKGSALTHTEMDANFTNLNTDKLESSNLKTINNTSIVGSGNISAGASTTNNTVGSYASLYYGGGGSNVDYGATRGTSYLTAASLNAYATQLNIKGFNSGISGTWRCMGYIASGQGWCTWVRIS